MAPGIHGGEIMAKLIFRRLDGEEVVLFVGPKAECDKVRDKAIEADGEWGILHPERYKIEEV